LAAGAGGAVAVIFSFDSLAEEEYCMGGATTAGDFCAPPINVLTGDGAITGLSRGLEEPDLVLNNPPRNPPDFFLDSLESVDACLCLIGDAVAWETELLKVICGVLGMDGAIDEGVSRTSDSWESARLMAEGRCALGVDGYPETATREAQEESAVLAERDGAFACDEAVGKGCVDVVLGLTKG